MTKKEIVRTISDEIGLTQLQTKEIVQKTFNAIVEALVEEGRIELRNFGVFEVKRRAPRKARNPRTGEKVFVAEKYVVTFKPGKEMEERVRELERQAAARAKLAAEGAVQLQKNSAPQRVTTTRPMMVLSRFEVVRPRDPSLLSRSSIFLLSQVTTSAVSKSTVLEYTVALVMDTAGGSLLHRSEVTKSSPITRS